LSLAGRLEDVRRLIGFRHGECDLHDMGTGATGPSLSLPGAQTVVTLLETFGWRAFATDPLTTAKKRHGFATGQLAKKTWPARQPSFEDSALSDGALG